MTAYDMRISDWSSDVCSSDLVRSSICGRVRTSSAGPGSSQLRHLPHLIILLTHRTDKLSRLECGRLTICLAKWDRSRAFLMVMSGYCQDAGGWQARSKPSSPRQVATSSTPHEAIDSVR